MYQLKTSASFDSAHFLKGYYGKCANIHGHHWVVEVVIASDNVQESGEKRGMIIDFGDFKKIVKNAADSFDHTLIYEKNSLSDNTLKALEDENFRLTEVPFRPTAENFAKYFFGIMKSAGIFPLTVTVYETPENCAVYGE